MKMALQLWSVRDEANSDFKNTARLVKDMGYEGVEIAGVKTLSYTQMGEILNDYGLKPLSAHISLAAANDEKVLEELKTVGIEYAVFNGMGIAADGISELCEKLARIGEKCREYGIYLMYHNHCYEFDKINGKPGLDLVYGGVSPKLLGAEIDTCWVQNSGINPAEYIKRHAGRCPLIHIKDYRGEHNTDSFTYTTVGNGELELEKVINAAAASGTKWLIVEQDGPESGFTPMQSAKDSAEFLLTGKYRSFID